MSNLRVERLNSLIKEVISETLRKDIHHIEIISPSLVTITQVSITNDLAYAKVLVSVLGPEQTKAKVIAALNGLAGLIGSLSSKKMRIRHFPHLEFFIDEGLEKQMRVQELLSKISDERKNRPQTEEE